MIHAITESTSFRRDRFTWIAYLMLGWFGYMQAIIGPMMPFLRQELRLNYAVSGLHMATYALGIAVTGLFGDRVAACVGRPAVFWGGGFGMALASGLLMAGTNPYCTLAGTGLMGLLGGLLFMSVQSTLTDRHGVWRTLALTEANILSGLTACFSPLLIGGMQAHGWGWRGALLVADAVLVVIAVLCIREPLPRPDECRESRREFRGPELPVSKLPGAFWAWWTVMLLVVSVEWSMGMWAALYLESVVGLRKVLAATLMVVYCAAFVVGRVVASRMTRTTSLHVLQVRAFAVASVGLLLFWLPRTPAMAVVGLLIVGLGVANFFPLTLSIAVATCPERSEEASARILFAVGLGGLIAPLSVGLAADRTSLFAAYSIIAIVLLLAATTAALVRRRTSVPV